LASVRERGGVILFGRSDLGYGQCEPGHRLHHRDLVVARVDLDQQFARFHPVIVLGVDVDDGPVDARAKRIYMAVYLRVVGGLVGLQVIPCKGRERTHRENQKNQQQNSFAYGTEPSASTRSATLCIHSVGRFDAPL
jgi:hypothetical protein